MISAVTGFANRHRRGLAITAGVTGGIYMMGKYAKSKLIEFQEKSSSERTAKENMKRRFEQNQQDCVFTVLSLLPTLGDQLLHELNVELITAKLQQTRSQRPTPLSTPDTSMILPSKPSESATTEEQEDQQQQQQQQQHPNDNNNKSQEINGKEETMANVTANGSHDSQEDSTKEQQQEEDLSRSEAGNETHSKDSSDAVTEDESIAKDTTITTSREEEEGSSIIIVETNDHSKDQEATGDDGTGETQVNGTTTAPEIKVQEKEEGSSAEEQQQEQQEQDTQLHKAAQTVVRDEVAAAIERRTKIELWNELKVMSFTRTVTALYSLTFLTLLTQVQLNLLGRFTYVSSVVALSSTTDASVRVESATKGSLSSTNGQLDFQTEKKYLTFSYWLLHEGWRRWSEKVQEVVEDIVGGISLKRTLNAREFSELLGEIRARLEYTEVDGKPVPINMREYMLPDEASDEREVLRAGGVDEFDLIVDPVLRNLLDETRDFIDSEDFATVLDSTLSTTFARFNLALQPTFNPFLSQSGSGRPNGMMSIEEIEDEEDIDRSVPLASLLPLVARQVHLIINGVPNEYVESLAMVKELQAFSAIVYSSFSEQLTN